MRTILSTVGAAVLALAATTAAPAGGLQPLEPALAIGGAPILLATSRHHEFRPPSGRVLRTGPLPYYQPPHSPHAGYYLSFGGPTLGLGIPPEAYVERRFAPAAPVVISIGAAHVDWCHTRYRSYRAHDNTFQPHRGPRRMCRSPYY